MTTLLLSTGPLDISDLSPAFAAPPDLASIVSIRRAGPELFFHQPFPRITMLFKTRWGNAFMASPVKAVSMLQGSVIVRVLGQWIQGVVQRG
jgi:hypothetical protein